MPADLVVTPWAHHNSYASGSVTKRLLCIPIQSTYECKTRGEERWHCPPKGEADVHNSHSIPWQDALPYAFEAVLDSNLFVTLPCLGRRARVLHGIGRLPVPKRPLHGRNIPGLRDDMLPHRMPRTVRCPPLYLRDATDRIPDRIDHPDGQAPRALGHRGSRQEQGRRGLPRGVLGALVHLSLSRLKHWLPWSQAHPEVMESTTDFYHAITDALLPQVDPVFDDATTLHAAVDMLAPEPSTV